MRAFNKIIFATAIAIIPCMANALEYNIGNTELKLTGFGTFGIIEPDMESVLSIGDWRLKGQATYSDTFGIVYALDKSALDKGNWSREAFVFLQSRDIGRIEIGYTDSIARKLGLGLPDVGGLRINERPLYNEKIIPDGPIIADTSLTSGRNEPLRINVASASNDGIQYGMSISGLSNEYDFAGDIGIKFRQSSGKLKTAYSVGASFINRPNDFDVEVYTPGVTADWRAQIIAGLNLQYNSWILGVTARAIYDENPIGEISDGIATGIGASYDLLKYSISLTYMLSDTGIWHSDAKDFIDHTVVASFRYKYSENVDGWISTGLTSKTTFVSAGLRLVF